MTSKFVFRSSKVQKETNPAVYVEFTKQLTPIPLKYSAFRLFKLINLISGRMGVTVLPGF